MELRSDSEDGVEELAIEQVRVAGSDKDAALISLELGAELRRVRVLATTAMRECVARVSCSCDEP